MVTGGRGLAVNCCCCDCNWVAKLGLGLGLGTGGAVAGKGDGGGGGGCGGDDGGCSGGDGSAEAKVPGDEADGGVVLLPPLVAVALAGWVMLLLELLLGQEHLPQEAWHLRNMEQDGWEGFSEGSWLSALIRQAIHLIAGYTTGQS